MKNSVRFLIAALAVASSFADPYPQGQGQGWPNGQQGDQGRHGGWRRCDSRAYSDYLSQLDQLSNIIRRGQYDGSYDPTTARKFNRAVAQDRAILERDYQYDRCIDNRERSDLDTRINALKEQMRTYDRRPGRH